MADPWKEEKYAKIKAEFNSFGDEELERSKNFFIGGNVALTMFAQGLEELIKPVEELLSTNGSKLVNTILTDMINRAKLQAEVLDKQADVASSIQAKRMLDKFAGKN